MCLFYGKHSNANSNKKANDVYKRKIVFDLPKFKLPNPRYSQRMAKQSNLNVCEFAVVVAIFYVFRTKPVAYWESAAAAASMDNRHIKEFYMIMLWFYLRAYVGCACYHCVWVRVYVLWNVYDLLGFIFIFIFYEYGVDLEFDPADSEWIRQKNFIIMDPAHCPTRGSHKWVLGTWVAYDANALRHSIRLFLWLTTY